MASYAWLNIFGVLKESDKSPYSRTLRTGFFDKLKDTFHILAGPIDIAEDAPYVGVFDYLTFLLFYANTKLFQWTQKHLESDDPVYWIVIALSFIASLVGGIARVAFGAAITLLTSPFVFAANLFIDRSLRWHANKYKETIYNIKGKDNSYRGDGTSKSLLSFLNDHRIGLEDLTMRLHQRSTVVEAGKVAVKGTVSVVDGLRSAVSYIPGLGGVAPPQRTHKKAPKKKKVIATLSLFYKHPEEQSCWPTCWVPDWNSLFFYYCICPSSALYQGGKYATEQVAEGAKSMIQGVKQDEFLIDVYEDDEEQAKALDALFLLNVGAALTNPHLDIHRDTPKPQKRFKEAAEKDTSTSLLRLHISNT